MARCLLITHIFPPAVDGGSKVISKIGDYLDRQGNLILILTSNCRSSDEFSHHYQPIKTSKNKNIIRLPVFTSFHRPFKFLSKYLPIFSIFKIGPIFKLIPFIFSLIKIVKFKPEYIIAGPLPTTVVLYTHLIRYLTKVLTFHSSKVLINASFHYTDKDFYNPLLIHCLKKSDYLWTLTDFETNYFHQKFDIPISKMINVGNGVDSSFLTKAPTLYRSNALSLLFVGSFAAHKGIETLVDAFVIISNNLSLQRSNDLSLCLAGQPTLYSPIIEKKINLLPKSIRSKIKIIYNFPPSQLSTLIDSSSILISPSTQESFGLILIEAIARKKPFIAANIPASAEIIRKTKGGLLFKTNNPKDLSSKILKLYRSKALQLSLGQKGFDYVQSHCTWDRIGKTIWQKISSS